MTKANQDHRAAKAIVAMKRYQDHAAECAPCGTQERRCDRGQHLALDASGACIDANISTYDAQAIVAKNAAEIAAASAHVAITDASREIFLAYAEDAGNWSGQPLVGGNVGGGKEERGNLTQLKRAGLITTVTDGDGTWITFTDLGLAYAAKLGVKVSVWS